MITKKEKEKGKEHCIRYTELKKERGGKRERGEEGDSPRTATSDYHRGRQVDLQLQR